MEIKTLLNSTQHMPDDASTPAPTVTVTSYFSLDPCDVCEGISDVEPHHVCSQPPQVPCSSRGTIPIPTRLQVCQLSVKYDTVCIFTGK